MDASRDPTMPIWIGLDIGVKRDATAIVAATWCKETKRVKLVWAATFNPAEDGPLEINSLWNAGIWQDLVSEAPRL